MVLITDERCTEYAAPGHPERPERVLRTTQRLREQREIAIEWDTPEDVEESVLLRGHTAEHLRRLADSSAAFDGDTPAHPGILDHARRAVGGAMRALTLARKGTLAFSLLRPPGHHALKERAMGFCYLGNIALVTLEALQTGTSRMAIFDFDVHHGNGTESMLAGVPGAWFASVHQHPCYPGTGTEDVSNNCFNYPVPPRHPREEYRKVLESALERLLRQRPDVLGISAGFDAYARDPLAHGTLEAEDYHWLGAKIRATGLPVVSILEGGYSNDLPELVFAYLKGLHGA